MKDKIILITGASDGIGKKAALELAKLGNTVLIHGRNAQKTNNVANSIRSQINEPEKVDVFLAELSSFMQIIEMCEEIRSKYDRLDVLINNAGVQMQNYELSEDGYEKTMAINHLAYFLITSHLIDLVAKSNYARIINVASGMHYRAELDFDNLQAEKGYELYPIYAQSKLCNVMFTYYLAERVQSKGITVNTLHPGLVDTNLNPMRSDEVVQRALSVEQGIVSLMRCTIDSELSTVTGKYFDSDGSEVKSSDISYDKGLQEKLWEKTEKLVGEKFRFP